MKDIEKLILDKKWLEIDDIFEGYYIEKSSITQTLLLLKKTYPYRTKLTFWNIFRDEFEFYLEKIHKDYKKILGNIMTQENNTKCSTCKYWKVYNKPPIAGNERDYFSGHCKNREWIKIKSKIPEFFDYPLAKKSFGKEGANCKTWVKIDV